jgi:hypothetical protein
MKISYYSHRVYIGAILFLVIVSIFVGIQHSNAQIYPSSQEAEIVIDPRNKKNITGNLQIALAWGELLRPPLDLQRGVIHLKDAMNRYTKVNTILDKHLLLGSNQLLRMPFVFVTSKEMFTLSETEKENLKKYFDMGGFMVLDNAEPLGESSRGGASLKQMIRDTIPNARFQPIPDNHPVYHCFFDFNDGPPNGAEIGLFGREGRKIMSKQRLYLEGVWHNGRLAAIYSDKGYIIKWNDTSNNEPQLRIGVNMIIYALTHEGGMTNKY